MKGTCPNNCKAEMDPPAVTVVIHDLEQGSAIGYYCKRECALADAQSTFQQMIDGGAMAEAPGEFSTIREPSLVMEPPDWPKGTEINVGLEMGQRGTQPPYNHRGYQMAQNAYATLTQALVYKATEWNMEAEAEGRTPEQGQAWMWMFTDDRVETPQGFLLPHRLMVLTSADRDFEVKIGHDDAKVWLTFPQEGYNLRAEPRLVDGENQSFIFNHVRVQWENSPERGATPPPAAEEPKRRLRPPPKLTRNH